jgi:hypothetical protein
VGADIKSANTRQLCDPVGGTIKDIHVRRPKVQLGSVAGGKQRSLIGARCATQCVDGVALGGGREGHSFPNFDRGRPIIQAQRKKRGLRHQIPPVSGFFACLW